MSGSQHHNAGLATIAVFKLLKAVLLVGAGVAAWQLVDPAVEEQLRHWAQTVPLGFADKEVRHLLARFSGLSAQRWKQLGVLSFLYAGVFVVEGIGLWRELVWAEYLTIVMSSLLLPFEIVEVARHATPLRVAVLAGNALVVAYLVWYVRRERRRRAQRAA